MAALNAFSASPDGTILSVTSDSRKAIVVSSAAWIMSAAASLLG